MVEVQLKRIGRQELYKTLFPFNMEMVEKIKLLSTEQRGWDAEAKIWTLTAIGVYNLITLFRGRDDIFFSFEDDKQKELFRNIVKKHKARLLKKAEKLAELENWNKSVLEMKDNLVELTKDFDYSKYLKPGIVPMPHQVQGAYLSQKLGNILVTAGLGTGKTLLSLLACEMDETIKKVLVICPNSLKINILNEVYKFTNSTAYIVNMKNGKLDVKYKVNRGLDVNDAKYLIVNYDYFRDSLFPMDKKVTSIGAGLQTCDCIIFDEAHKLGYKDSNTTRNIKNAFDNAIHRRILLTGTPIQNKLKNLYQLLKIVKPLEFTNENKFFTTYCGLRYDPNNYGWVKDENNPPNLSLLNEKLQTCMFRVTNSVLDDLPKLYQYKLVISMTSAEEKEYKEIENGLKKVDWSKNLLIKTQEDESDAPIVILNRLRQFTSQIKAKHVAEMVETFNSEGHKTIVFDNYKAPLKVMKDILGSNSEVYSGDISVDERQELVYLFEDKKSSLLNLCISMAAGNAGITLVAATRVILASQNYLPSWNEQAIARAWRKGATEDIYAYVVVVNDTIDELVYEAVEEKVKVVNKVIDNIDYDKNLEVSVLSDILKKLKLEYN